MANHEVTTEQLVQAICREANHELADASKIIRHCLKQLNTEQIWWRPDESTNSIGNLILHLCGNVTQWIVAGLGGEEDRRQRQSEFDHREPLAGEELLQRLDATLRAVELALSGATADDYLSDRVIQGFPVNGLRAVFHPVSHFRGHVQEIVHITRRQLGADYEFNFVPSSPAEGAAEA